MSDQKKDPRISVEAASMIHLARQAVEDSGADAVLVVWTQSSRRRTSVHSVNLGNQLAVQGLMRWIRARIDEIDEADDGDEEEDEDDEED